MSGHNDAFRIEQIRPWNVTNLQNSIGIITPHPPAHYPIGLTQLVTSRSTNTRIKSYIDNVKFIESDGTFSATVHLDAWSDTVLYLAGCTWLPIPKPDREFQHGRVAIKGDQLVYNLTFGQEYASQPKVVVWINGLELGLGGWHVRAEATSVTSTGFTLRCTTWNNVQLHQAQVTWIAYPESRTNIDSGQFDLSQVPARQDMQHNNSKTVNFSKRFDRTPKVYFALSGIDANSSTDLRLTTSTSDATWQSVALHAKSWHEPNLHNAWGQWIAIQDL